MALITGLDLETRIYPEIRDQITRLNQNAIDAAINDAISEAKAYLSKYDLLALFGNDDIAATVQDDFLKNMLKDIAVWNLTKLGNPNLDYDHNLKCYDQSIKNLAKIQEGKMNPDSWPYADTTGQTAPQGDAISYSSNPRKSTHF